MGASKQKLSDFNDRMEKELVDMSREYGKHQGMLREMKSDLEYVMKKIRFVYWKNSNFSFETLFRSLQNKFGESTTVSNEDSSVEVKPKQFS